MSRFYFSVITTAEKIVDEEGTELPDLDAARAEAIEDARTLMSDAILGGRDISDRSIEISNESGEVLMVVPFADAVSRLD
jgi:uncharacterized protein YbcI